MEPPGHSDQLPPSTHEPAHRMNSLRGRAHARQHAKRKEAQHSAFRFVPAWARQTNQKCRKVVVDASISNRAGLLAQRRPPYHCLHRHRLHHWSGAAFSPPLFRPPFWRRAPCPIHPASPQAWARSRAPSLALRPPRFDRAEASRRCHTLPACLGAHTAANCWPPRLHQTASEGCYCGARTFVALSPMAPAAPHTSARRRPFSAWWLQRLSRDCALPRLQPPRFVLTVQGYPWHRSRYPKQTVASNIQGTPFLYVDGTSGFLVEFAAQPLQQPAEEGLRRARVHCLVECSGAGTIGEKAA